MHELVFLGHAPGQEIGDATSQTMKPYIVERTSSVIQVSPIIHPTFVGTSPVVFESRNRDLTKLDEFYCQLTGFAVLEISGKVSMEGLEGTNVYIHGAQELDVNGVGERTECDDWIFLFGWHGRVEVAGVNCQIQVGGPMRSGVDGSGVARLRGKGCCIAKGHRIELTDAFRSFSF